MTRLRLEDVTVRFGDTTALQDVSLDVRDGEFFTLVGPSGCGKTTTLRTVAGFQAPTAGRVRFGDVDVSAVPPEARGVGVVFQNYALFPNRSVAQNVAYGLTFRDPPGGVTPEERVTALLDLVDLSGMADRDPASLSGGQQQRVALARALAPGPDILLLDEPMSALDARLRQRLRGQVKAIQADLGITTLYVTHDQAEALAVSDRLAVMHDGRVEQVGTPEAVYDHPTSRFVAEFVGDNNVLHGTATPVETGGSAVGVGAGTVVTKTPVEGPCTVAIRPENLSFDSSATGDSVTETPTRPATDASDPTAPPTNDAVDPDRTGEWPGLDVTVTRTEFLGDAYRVHCDWHGTRLLVKTHGPPPSGDATVSYRPEDVLVLPD